MHRLVRQRAGPAIAALIFVALLSAPARAGDAPTANYDLTVRYDQVVVSLDLQSFLSSADLTRIKEGVDLALEYSLILKTPRRFFGSRKVAEQNQTLRVGYRPVTEDFIVRTSANWLTSHLFLTLPDLQRFLADSITLPLIALDSLEYSRSYVLNLKVTSILLTDLGLGQPIGSADSSSSPLQFLFRQFLTVTGYGRREFNFESSPFAPSDISSEP